MFSSIKQKLALVYILVILIPLVTISYLSVNHMEESILKGIEVNTLKTANILSNISQNNLDNPFNLRKSILPYATTVEGRILVLNEEGRVMVDTSHMMNGMVIDNEEVKVAFNMQESLGYYQTDKYILQVATPILQVTGSGRKVSGVVLVSLSVDAAFEAINDFKQQLILISTMAAFIGILVALLVSEKMSRPIVELSEKAKRIGEGNFGERVEIKSKDEIGRLAENFNHMSQELYRIDKGRTQFIGDVSHELKTPLASMKALIDSLLYGEDDIQVYREYLGDIDGEIDRLADLVKSLLSFTKIGEEGINLEPTSLNEILESATRILHPLSVVYDVEVLMDIEDPPEILCDKNRITEVFINLVDNALKYRDVEKEQSRVIINGRNMKDGYEIRIVDNGLGIREEELKSIFEKFYRGDTSRSRDTGGVGIGLSIVSRILKLHQWEICVDSKVKEGTTIILFIPKTSLSLSL